MRETPGNSEFEVAEKGDFGTGPETNEYLCVCDEGVGNVRVFICLLSRAFI